MAKWDFSLSASKLGIFKDCPRCFYLHVVHKVERPRGIFPSLPGGMDRIIKDYFDCHRGIMPGPFGKEIPGELWGSVERITKLRNWQSGMKPIITTPHGVVGMIGALDDLAFHDGVFSPVDAKTKGNAVKDGDTEKYYGHQADIYALMLRETGMPPSGKAYFVYFWPVGASDPAMVGTEFAIGFGFRVISIDALADRAFELLCKATELLRSNLVPQASPDCEYCSYATKRNGF